MAAHELGHCRRYLDGTWFGARAGFAVDEPPGRDPELRAAWRTMHAVRLEEGYADLVGLGWTREHHPQDYARLHAWLVEERSRDLVRAVSTTRSPGSASPTTPTSSPTRRSSLRQRGCGAPASRANGSDAPVGLSFRPLQRAG
jgi:hypothetical protein